MKLSLEYDEVVRMLSRELGRDIKEDDITITSDPFSIEIRGLDLEDLLQIRATRAHVSEVASQPSENDAEKPMAPAPVDTGRTTVDEIAGLLSANQSLSTSGGGAGPVPDDPHNIPDTVVETPEDFLPAGATYDSPGEMSPEEIKGRTR